MNPSDSTNRLSGTPVAASPSIAMEFLSTVGELCTSLVTAAQGMMVTAKYLVKPSEIVTLQYPREKFEIAKNYRGRLLNAIPRCIVCELCAKACPTNCISMEFEIGADKKRILHNFNIDMTICLYCGLCTEACPDTTKEGTEDKCLTMQGGYEYSSDRKESIGFYHTASNEELDSLRAVSTERAAKAAAAKVIAAAAVAKKAEEEKAKAAVGSAPVVEVAKPSPKPVVSSAQAGSAPVIEVAKPSPKPVIAAGSAPVIEVAKPSPKPVIAAGSAPVVELTAPVATAPQKKPL